MRDHSRRRTLIETIHPLDSHESVPHWSMCTRGTDLKPLRDSAKMSSLRHLLFASRISFALMSSPSFRRSLAYPSDLDYLRTDVLFADGRLRRCYFSRRNWLPRLWRRRSSSYSAILAAGFPSGQPWTSKTCLSDGNYYIDDPETRVLDSICLNARHRTP